MQIGLNELFKKYSIKIWKQNKLQIIFSIISISIAVAAMTCIQLTTVFNSKYADDNARFLNGGDMQINMFTSYVSNKQLNYLNKLQKDNSIDYAKAFSTEDVVSYNGDYSLSIVKVIDSNKYPLFKQTDNNRYTKLFNKNSCFVTKPLANRLDIKKNKSVSLNLSGYMSSKKSFKVNGVITNSADMKEKILGGAIIDYSTFKRYIDKNIISDLRKRKMTLANLANIVYIKINDSKDYNVIEKNISNMFSETASISTAAQFSLASVKLYKTTNMGISFIGVLAFMISGISIGITMFLLIIKRKRDLSIFRTFGMQDKDIKNLILYETVIISIIADIIGIISGIIATAFIVDLLRIPLSTDVYISSSIPIIILTAILGILESIAFTRIPIAMCTKIKPITVLRNQETDLYQYSQLLEPCFFSFVIAAAGLMLYLKSEIGGLYVLAFVISSAIIWFFLVSVIKLLTKLKIKRSKTLLLAFKNLKSQYRRYGLVFTVFIFGTFISSTVYNVSNTAMPQILKNYVVGNGYNVTLASKNNNSNKIERIIKNDKKINSYSKVLVTHGQLSGINEKNIEKYMNYEKYTSKDKNDVRQMCSDIAVQAFIGPSHGIKHNLSYGRDITRADRGKNTAVVGSYFGDSFGLGVGDYISININGKILKLKIIGTIKNNFISGETDIWTDDNTLKKYTTNNSINYANRTTSTQYWMKTKGSNTNIIIQELYKKFGTDKNGLQILDVGAEFNSVNRFLEDQIGIYLFLSLICILSSIFLITSIILISFMDRKKEFVIMRVVGAKQKNIAKMILTENLIMGLISGILANIFCEIATGKLAKAIFNAGGYHSNIYFDLIIISISVAIAEICCCIAMPKSKVKNLNSVLRID